MPDLAPIVPGGAPGCPGNARSRTACGHDTFGVDLNTFGGMDAPAVLGELLATDWSDVRTRLLGEHTDDGNGRCRVVERPATAPRPPDGRVCWR